MLLAEKKEREYRFKLALRIGLPIIFLITAFIIHTFINNYLTLTSTFYFEATFLIFIIIYFIFYLIYNGFSVKITDDVTKTFTREYLYKYLNSIIKNRKEYTFILISIDNLSDINKLYGIKNGDKVLKEVVLWIVQYFRDENIINSPLGHIGGGNFILGIDAPKDRYTTLLDMFCFKSNELKINNIEIKLSSAITDIKYSKELDYIIEHLFEIQNKRKITKMDEMNPNELESLVVNSIKEKRILFRKQIVIENNDNAFIECFVKLKGENSKIIHPKTYMKVVNKLSLGADFDILIVEEILKNNLDNNLMHAVNILPTSIRNDTFLLKINELYKKYGNLNLMFILSEFEYYSYTQRYNNILEKIKKFGIKIAIDRMGSIHTSFLYLRELNIDVIRFDKYYSNAEKLEKNINILEGFTVMAHEKGLKTWIKNIQTQESLKIAKNLKTDYLQGRYISDVEIR